MHYGDTFLSKKIPNLIVNQITFKMSQVPKRLIVIVIVIISVAQLNSSTSEMFLRPCIIDFYQLLEPITPFLCFYT